MEKVFIKFQGNPTWHEFSTSKSYEHLRSTYEAALTGKNSPLLEVNPQTSLNAHRIDGISKVRPN